MSREGPEGQESVPEDDEIDDEEEIVCTHLQNNGSSQRAQPPPEGPPSSNNSPDDSNSGPSFPAEAAKTAGVAAGVGVAAPTIATAGLTAAGFTSSGIAAGSMAAASQAAIGNVAAGSLFATLQSVGATGGFAILGPVGLGAAAVAGTTCAGFRWWRSRTNDGSGNNNDNNDNGDDKGNGKGQHKGKDGKGECDSIKEEQQREFHKVRGVNVCDECWLKMQKQRYKQLAKKGKGNKK